MKAKIIVNPFANRWRAKAQIPAIEAAFNQAGLAHELVILPEAGSGKAEAQRAAEDDYDWVIAAGGDGTVNEVVNGLIAAAGDGPTKPLGILPMGTGNDFNDMAYLPRNLLSAVQGIATGYTRQVDAGKVTMDGRIHYFDNNCALAMEPMVTIENTLMKRPSGNLRYVIALVRALAKLKAWQMRFSWDEGEHEGAIILLSICNSPRTGGMFKMAPEAKMDDGLFDFVYAPDLPMATILTILPRLINGSHVRHPQISYKRTTKLVVESQPGTPIHADGEVIAQAAHQISYEILPGKITLLGPNSNSQPRSQPG